MTISDTEITGCWSAIRGEAASKKVTLTLSVHDGSASGPLVPGAQVTGRAGSGNIFQRTTDESGYITIKGDPGTWSFSASASGYETNSWDQDITDTCTKHAFLTRTQGSGNSVVGTWRINHPNCKSDCVPYEEITFNEDGTYTRSSGNRGHWVQHGNVIRFVSDTAITPIEPFDASCLCIEEGKIEFNTMNGGALCPKTYPCKPVPSGPDDIIDYELNDLPILQWNAVRADTAVRVGTEESGNQDESTTLRDQAGKTPVNEGITGPRYYVGTILPDGTSITTSGIRGTMCDPPKDGRPV